MFSINVELTSTFLLYRGLVHHHHRILRFTRSGCKDTDIPKFKLCGKDSIPLSVLFVDLKDFQKKCKNNISIGNTPFSGS